MWKIGIYNNFLFVFYFFYFVFVWNYFFICVINFFNCLISKWIFRYYNYSVCDYRINYGENYVIYYFCRFWGVYLIGYKLIFFFCIYFEFFIEGNFFVIIYICYGCYYFIIIVSVCFEIFYLVIDKKFFYVVYFYWLLFVRCYINMSGVFEWICWFGDRIF